MDDEIELKVYNYHDDSQKIEEALLSSILLLLSPLVITLSSITPLTQERITSEVQAWFISNTVSINELNNNHLRKVVDIVSGIFKKKVEADAQIEKFVLANNNLVRIIVDNIAMKFKELAIIESVYPMSDEVRQDYIDNIISFTEDKVELFSVMSTISTIRTMMFERAVIEGFSEYMWETQRDRKVRPTHAYMDKRWVRIDEAPKETGYFHVGEDYGCRCYACRFR